MGKVNNEHLPTNVLMPLWPGFCGFKNCCDPKNTNCTTLCGELAKWTYIPSNRIGGIEHAYCDVHAHAVSQDRNIPFITDLGDLYKAKIYGLAVVV